MFSCLPWCKFQGQVYEAFWYQCDIKLQKIYSSCLVLFDFFTSKSLHVCLPALHLYILFWSWRIHWQTPLSNQGHFSLFMLMVLAVSTNHIRKILCHWEIMGIMQIVTRLHFVITHLFGNLYSCIKSSDWSPGYFFFFLSFYLRFITVCHHLLLLLLVNTEKAGKKTSAYYWTMNKETKLGVKEAFHA